MVIRVLIIHRHLTLTVTIKQALERTGGFSVHPFTTADAAFEYLESHPQQVALVDFGLPTVSGEEIVAQLRLRFPKIAIIATPVQSDALIRQLDLQGSIAASFSARDLVPLLTSAVENRRGLSGAPLDTTQLNPPDAARPGETELLEEDSETPKVTDAFAGSDDQVRITPARTRNFAEPGGTRMLGDAPDEAPEFSSLDDVLSEMSELLFEPPVTVEDTPFVFEESQSAAALGDVLNALGGEEPPQPRQTTRFDELLDSMRTDEPRSSMLADRTPPVVEFYVKPRTPSERLADEEPPMPGFDEGGTIGDLLTGITDPSFRHVLSLLRGEEREDENTVEDFDLAITGLLDDLRAEFEFEPTDDPHTERLSAVTQSTRTVRPDGEEPGFDFSDDDSDPTPAHFVLSAAENAEIPLETFSLDDVLASIEEQQSSYRPNVRPLPSWLRDAGRSLDSLVPAVVEEPDFLPPELPELEQTDDLYDQTTLAREPIDVRGSTETESFQLDDPWRVSETPLTHSSPITSPDSAPPFVMDEDDIPVVEVDGGWTDGYQFDDEDWETALLSRTEVLQAQPAAPETPELARLDEEDYLESALFDTTFDRLAAFEFGGTQDDEVQSTPAIGVLPVDDPRIAQLAVSLTQFSLELTAEATLLTRESAIVAYAGRLTREDVEALRETIADSVDSNRGEARFRFVNLSGSGKDYLIYSQLTVDQLTLSMVFAASTSLSDIRTQMRRLSDALLSVPVMTTPVTPELPPASVEPLVRTPYTYVWVTRQPDLPLAEPTAQAIATGLRTQLSELSWLVSSIHAADQYIYLVADVPGETPAPDVVRELKRRAARIAASVDGGVNADALWADSYLVVTPGRELDIDEIRQFLDFERMAF